MHTEDGGETWADNKPPGWSRRSIVSSVRGDRLYAAGDHAVVLSYRDGVWVQLETPNIPIYLSAGPVLSHQQLLVAGGWGDVNDPVRYRRSALGAGEAAMNQVTHWLHNIDNLVFRHPRSLLSIIALITVFFAFQIPGLKMYSDFADLLPQSHPYIELHNEIKDTFWWR